MKIITDTKIIAKLTVGSPQPYRRVLAGLLIASIFSLYACSTPSPTSSGSSSGVGVPSPGGGVPNPGGGVPNPGGGVPNPGGGDPGGSTASPSGGDAGDSSDGSGESSSAGESGKPGDSIEGLDEALDESLEDFDETVLAEGNRSNTDGIDILSPTGTSGGIDSDEPLFEEANSDGAAESNASIEQRAAEGAPPGADSSDSDFDSGASAEQADSDIIPIPDDIDDGQGDDIVLRQIRDAAIKERDPILREKLWDEYRRIKSQG
jgi:hypothetical protein